MIRNPGQSSSLAEVHDSVGTSQVTFWRRMFAFAGPAYLVSVGYMDPGNWATDIEGGARFGYMLLWVLLMSNLMALLLQTLATRLGVVTGHDLAQGCRREYPPAVRTTLWGLTELAVAATDLAEALGTIVALNLLFGIPLLGGCIITAFDTLLFLVLQRFGIRKLEAFIVMLVATVGLCFVVEVVLAKPDMAAMAAGFVPHMNGAALFVAIGIIGATVMPHNLYLHSSLVQSRGVSNTVTGKRQACRFNLVDSTVALNAAFFVNAAILVTAAANFHSRGIVVTQLEQAHLLLGNVLGHTIAPAAFAVALLAAGQSSTITGTISGQIVMEGFLNLRFAPWLRRLVTRLLALAPAVVVIAISGSEGIYRLLVLSQVVLSLQLPFAIIPLIHFTSDRRKMGGFANPRWLKALAWLVAAVIVGLNGKLVFDALRGWMSGGSALAWGVAAPAGALLVGLLAYLILRPLWRPGEVWEAGAATAWREVAAGVLPFKVHRGGVAREHTAGDAAILSAGAAMARAHGARLLLLHVVDTPGVMMLGAQSASLHGTADAEYLEELARDVEAPGLPAEAVLRFGRPAEQLVQAVRELGLDLLVVGSHGHHVLADAVYGETVTSVRHRVRIPVLIVPSGGGEPALHPGDSVAPAAAGQAPTPALE